jgi:ISXO2-like transposase domain
VSVFPAAVTGDATPSKTSAATHFPGCGPLTPRPHPQGDHGSPDESGAWDNLHDRFEMKRIDHSQAYSFDVACTNQAEEYFSRLRRAEIGIHHQIVGAYLLRYAQESSWREDTPRLEWRSGEPRSRTGDEARQVCGLHGVLAAPRYRLISQSAKRGQSCIVRL